MSFILWGANAACYDRVQAPKGFVGELARLPQGQYVLTRVVMSVKELGGAFDVTAHLRCFVVNGGSNACHVQPGLFANLGFGFLIVGHSVN